jgi:hypothetical protein
MKNAFIFLGLAVLLFSNSAVAQNLPAYLPANGLVAWYPFNGNANDESGNGFNSVSNSASLIQDRNGNPNSAYQLGGGFIQLPVGVFNFQRNESFTISVWFTHQSAANARLMSSENPEGNFRIANWGTYPGSFATQYGDYLFDTLPNPTQWNHLVYAYSQGNEKTYVNGVLTNVNFNSSSQPCTYSYPFCIGAKASCTSCDRWQGKVDDFAIYNRALTQEEITALYTGMPVNGGGGNTSVNPVPPGIPYQAVVRNANGQVAANAAVTTRFTLHQNTADGAVEYQETHALATNAQGLMSTVLGQGTAVQNTFASINWANTTKFLQVEVDLGNGYVDLGTQQLMSVPYAMYAANAPAGPQGPAGADGATGATGPQGPAGAGGFTHWVGEVYGGGVVFHVYRDHLGEEHGLIVSLNDLSSSATWGLFGTDVNNCESTWNGAGNSASIIAAGAENGSAAHLCDAYEGGGFTDWYLPAINELVLMNNVQFNLNQSLSQIPGGTLFDINAYLSYWSSTEADSDNAWRLNTSSPTRTDKNSPFNFSSVRAVRAF